MTSLKKDGIPPARPPAPKLSMSKMKSRQHSTGSIAIRFNASSLEDDYDVEDEIVMGTSPSEAVRFEVGNTDLSLKEATPASKPVELRSGGVSGGRNSGRCKSAPVSEVTTPVSAGVDSASSLLDCNMGKPQQDVVMPTKEETSEKSLFSGIRERFQDPLTSLLDKVDELSGESGIADAIDRKLKIRAPSVEGSGARNGVGATPTKPPSVDRRNGQSTPLSKTPSLDRTVPYSSVKTHPLEHNDKADSSGVTAEVNVNGTTTSTTFQGPEEMWTRTGSFEIVDDFFSEPLDSTESMTPSSSPGAGGHVLVKSNSSDQILRSCRKDSSQKPAKARLRVKKSKNKVDNEKVTVSLSGILSNNGKDMEDALIEEEKFYDLEESKGTQKDISRQISQSGKKGPESDLPLPMIPKHRIIAAAVCFVAYLIIPMPSFLSGAILGATLAAIGILMYQWFTAPPAPREPIVFADLEGLPDLEVPVMKESKNEDGRFKGWMNELGHYDPDNYHINQTQSVYVQLEGTNLRLQTPRQNVPKRSMWNESQVHTPSFVSQRHLELSGSKVSLLPEGLVKKRLWSKKYPICVHLSPSAQHPPGQKSQSEESLSPANSSLSQEATETSVLYLFARTGREKEEWFRRLDAAAKSTPLPSRMMELVHKLEGWGVRSSSTSSSSSSVVDSGMRHKRQGSADSNSSDPGRDEAAENTKTPEQVLTEYVKFMARIMPASELSTRVRPSGRILCEPVVLWANALVARGFWDFLREAYWADRVKDKIQKKLSKIHVPYFIDELTVTGIDLGRELPVIRRVSKPYLDDRGLWVDMEVGYSGGFQMSLETKVNLMKLKRTRSPREHKARSKRSPVTDEEEEDSAESSTDDEAADDIVETTDDRGGNSSQPSGGNTSKKILRFVDKIAASKYFQQATENKYIKKAMEGVSNTRLMLSVELKKLNGTLAVNIPPPPTDRLWYGFRTNPQLWLSAKPKVGSREVNVSHITDWIEKKLIIEFQRVFVMPNMDDLPVPLLFDHIQEPEGLGQQLSSTDTPQSDSTPQS